MEWKTSASENEVWNRGLGRADKANRSVKVNREKVWQVAFSCQHDEEFEKAIRLIRSRPKSISLADTSRYKK